MSTFTDSFIVLNFSVNLTTVYVLRITSPSKGYFSIVVVLHFDGGVFPTLAKRLCKTPTHIEKKLSFGERLKAREIIRILTKRA